MHNLKKILGYGGALARRDRGEPLEDPALLSPLSLKNG